MKPKKGLPDGYLKGPIENFLGMTFFIISEKSIAENTI
jgi:hypothetical protein